MVTTDRIDGLTAEVAIKAPVRVATTENITLSGAQTIDGVAVVNNDRVLVKDQTDGVENGIYDASTTAWSRSKDFNGNRDIVQGTTVLVNAGTASASQTFVVDTANDIIIGTTSISISQYSPVVKSDIDPLVAGAADPGTSSEISRADHVHPSAKDVAESLTNKILNDDTNFIHADGVHIKARNVSGGPFARGQVVYENAYNSGQDAIEILLADASVAAKMPGLAIVDEAILNNANGSIIKVGTITGDPTDNLDTTGGGEMWSVGDDLFISTTAGNLTNVRPTGAAELVQAIAVVLRVHASLGVIFVDGAGRANDIPNSGTAEAGFLGKSFPLGNLNSATTLHIIDGNIQHGTMTGSFTLTAPDDTDDGYCEVELTIDATGAYTLTLSGFNEVSGTADMTANVVNILRISKLNTNTYLEIIQAV